MRPAVAPSSPGPARELRPGRPAGSSGVLPRRVGARQFTPCSGLCLRRCGATRPKRAGGPGKIIMRGSGCHRRRHRPGLRLPRASGAQQAPPPLPLSKATRGLAAKGLGLETGPFRPRQGALLCAGTRPLPAPPPRAAPGRDHPPPPAPTKPKKPPTSRQRFRPAPRRAARPRVPPAPTLFQGGPTPPPSYLRPGPRSPLRHRALGKRSTTNSTEAFGFYWKRNVCLTWNQALPFFPSLKNQTALGRAEERHFK